MAYHIFAEFPTATDAEMVSRKIKEEVKDITDIVITAKAIDANGDTLLDKKSNIPYYTPDSVSAYKSEIPHEAYLEIYSHSSEAITKAGNIMTSMGGLKIYKD